MSVAASNWVSRVLPGVEHFLSVFRSEKRLLVRFVASSLGRTLASMAVIYLIQEFLSDVLGGGNGWVASWISGHFGSVATIWIVVVLLFGAYIVGALLNYDNQVTQQRIIKVFEMGIMERLIRHLLALSVPFINSQSPGDLIQAVRTDISVLRRMVRSMANILFEGVLALGLLGTAFWLSPSLAFWALCVLPVGSLPVVLLARRVRAKSYMIRKTGYVFFDIILQILSGIRVLKAYQAEEREAQITVERGHVFFDEMIEAVRLRSIGQVMLETLAGLGVVTVIVIGSFQVLNGSITWANFFAFLMAARALQGPLNSVYVSYMEMQTDSASVDRITELLHTQPQVRDEPDALPLPYGPQLIAFDGVGFAYDKALVLDGVSFEVRAGETIGIVGPSGAGKSTLLNLIARFYDPTHGSVLFDGEPLDQFRLADVYSRVAIVTQEPFLFAATVRENIRCGRPDATAAEVEKAARAAYIHDDILNLPLGYDTVIGLNGRALSRGQSQRINVARAFLKDASIILLDEPTSSLDAIGEAEVQWAMEELMKGRTSFLVTHRFPNLLTVDRFLVLDGGKCVDFGSHDELYFNCPLYRRLYDIQRSEEAAPRPEFN